MRRPQLLESEAEEMANIWRPLAARIALDRGDRSGYVIGVSGAVAVGKSTTSERLARVLRDRDISVDVVTTDGFLLPNLTLIERGLLERKGFPDSYDADRLRAFLADLRAGAETIAVPVYSHERYDVLAEPALFRVPDITIVEGVNALQPEFDYDLTIFVDADEPHIVAWYVTRFLELTEIGRRDPSSFYARFSSMSDGDVVTLAKQVWDQINRPNLHTHILPTRDRADVVIEKGADHRVRTVLHRDSYSPPHGGT